MTLPKHNFSNLPIFKQFNNASIIIQSKTFITRCIGPALIRQNTINLLSQSKTGHFSSTRNTNISRITLHLKWGKAVDLFLHNQFTLIGQQFAFIQQALTVVGQALAAILQDVIALAIEIARGIKIEMLRDPVAFWWSQVHLLQLVEVFGVESCGIFNSVLHGEFLLAFVEALFHTLLTDFRLSSRQQTSSCSFKADCFCY